MDSYLIAKEAEILALRAELEGMLAENKQREVLGHSMAYTEEDFAYLSACLRDIYTDCLNYNPVDRNEKA